MTVEQSGFDQLFIIHPKEFRDDRGYFFESFNQDQFYRQTGLRTTFVQDNEAKSKKGVLRGLHYQIAPYTQSKLVRVVQGRVLDVVVDIRKNSETFGKSFSIELSADNKLQLFVPKGFAHAYLVLEDDSIFSYKCDAFYNHKAEAGIRFDDPELNIEWPISKDELIVSEKDLLLPLFEDHIPCHSF